MTMAIPETDVSSFIAGKEKYTQYFERQRCREQGDKVDDYNKEIEELHRIGLRPNYEGICDSLHRSNLWITAEGQYLLGIGVSKV
jgi:hypothetical protein